jgi:hypothetical protein
LVLLNTVQALAAAGHSVDLVAPHAGPAADRRTVEKTLTEFCSPHLVSAGPRSTVGSLALGLARGVPTTVARHTLPAVRRKVAELLESTEIDVVHAEQLHALPQAAPARERGIPVVHRAHNVESMLWGFAAQHRSPATRSLIALEARRMSAWEVGALETSSCTVALTEPDREALAEMVPDASIFPVAAPFATELLPGETEVEGRPAVVTLASSAWAPSRDAVFELVFEIWPTIRRRLPDAVLHVFGGGHHLESGSDVVNHPPPADSRDAFPEGAVALVPARHPTGVPMKALEAWARGLPLLIERPTALALGAEDGVDAVIADGGGYASSLVRLVEEDGLWGRVVDGGRKTLRQRHDPAAVAEQLTKVYRWAISQGKRVEADRT